MINRILKYGTAVGIIISSLGYFLITTCSMSDNFNSVYDDIYKLTLIFSCLFILTVSEFINSKFNSLLKVIGLILLVIFGLNLISELNIYTFDHIEIIAFILCISLYFMYMKFFFKKTDKNKLDFLKMFFLTLVLASGFLDQFSQKFVAIEFLAKITFWIIILAHLRIKFSKLNFKFSQQ